MGIDGWPTAAEYMSHAARHQAGGSDEVDCTGLTGAGGGPGGTPPPGCLLVRHFVSITKTNIGAAYADIYVAGAFAERNLATIDWTDITQVRFVWVWDYVGTGSQQVRWVNAANNAEVLYESPAFTTDQDPADSGWITKPAAFTGIKVVEWQGKSSVAGDDPIPKGYAIYGK